MNQKELKREALEEFSPKEIAAIQTKVQRMVSFVGRMGRGLGRGTKIASESTKKAALATVSGIKDTARAADLVAYEMALSARSHPIRNGVAAAVLLALAGGVAPACIEKYDFKWRWCDPDGGADQTGCHWPGKDTAEDDSFRTGDGGVEIGELDIHDLLRIAEAVSEDAGLDAGEDVPLDTAPDTDQDTEQPDTAGDTQPDTDQPDTSDGDTVQPSCETDCDDEIPCTADECNEETWICTHTPIDEDCDDGFDCTDDYCEEGEGCQNIPVDQVCETDLNPCTDQVCDPEEAGEDSGTGCVTEYNEDPCDDGSSCTTGDKCTTGICTGTLVACDDGDPCTDDLCVDGDCETTPISGPECNDGDSCTTTDVCVEGECIGDPIICYTEDPCKGDYCEDGECKTAPLTGPECDDGDACTTGDTCENGVCGGVPVACNDGDPCTTDYCEDGECKTTTTDCDDGVDCTLDICVEGGCSHETVDALCPQGPQCTATVCTVAGCAYPATSGGACDDGDACTTGDACDNGDCEGTPVECDDEDPCTADYCEDGDCKTNPLTGPECDDGDACTTGDTCENGECEGTPMDCDDEVACTADSCVDGSCEHQTQDFLCEQGPQCTTATCTTDGCTNVALSGTPCDDNDPCTTEDTCQNGTCIPASQVECPDCSTCSEAVCVPECDGPYELSVVSSGHHLVLTWKGGVVTITESLGGTTKIACDCDEECGVGVRLSVGEETAQVSYISTGGQSQCGQMAVSSGCWITELQGGQSYTAQEMLAFFGENPMKTQSFSLTANLYAPVCHSFFGPTDED